ncbi:S-layer homology domain-containing protein [Sporomusa sphaeroides]|uniref:S-layer homology domain-containing protein n=1 Tax=Sporomusa sphaeroides TaxID=47679 RepID=UPI003158ABC2
MKRQTAMALAAVFAMSVAGTALAAPANPFVDVPAKHWSYDAVSKLAQAGVVSGYGDGTYKGDKTMTRYEMATIIAKAMANSEKADAETQKTIDALAAEYGAELNNLGVRVDNLEKKVGNVKFDGDVRLRYNNTDKDFNGKDSDLKARARLYAHSAINEDWTANVRFEIIEDMRKSGKDSSTDIDILNVTGPLFGTKATIGRFDVVPVYGTVIDSFVDGAKFEFGNKLKTTLIYGKEDNKFNFTDGSDAGTADVNLGFVGFGYAPSKATNLNAAYYHVEATNKADTAGSYWNGSDDTLKIWELGFDSKIAKNLVLQASYADSDADEQDAAYQAGLWYKGAKKQDKGSFGVWATYLNVEQAASLDSTWMVSDTLGSEKGNGFEGVEVGFNYALQKNVLFKTQYFDGETTANVLNSKTGKEEKQDLKKFRAQVEFFF